MCGIAGYIADQSAAEMKSKIQRMTDVIAHRGPDGEGHYLKGTVALGHRRLSIIDLSDMASQPMIDTNTGCALVFNGEIYNHIELRKQLIKAGYTFTSRSDTEVVLKAYLQWGADCVSHFNGMWSFAILDPRQGIIFCSRDRFGEKPFYFIELGNVLAFGSEIRQLLSLLPNVSVDRSTVLGFIHNRIAEPLDRTFYSRIRKLQAGHNLTIDIKTRHVRIEKYYSLELDPTASHLGLDAALERFSELLNSSIKMRLRSDVEVGTCLSGGLDSSAIATIASQIYREDSGQNFSAITAISEDPSSDESNFAKMVVEHSQLKWHTVRPEYSDFRNLIEKVVVAQEEPFSSASVLMQYIVMEKAHSLGIPVLLDGQGGDEALLGYHKYFATGLMHSFQNNGILEGMKFARGVAKNGDQGAIKQLILNVAIQSIPNVRKFALQKQNKLFIAPQASRLKTGDTKSLFAMQKEELFESNLPPLLRYEDKNSMAHSIETRLPFLDPEFVRFAVSLNSRLKMDRGWGKLILRQAMDGKMPDQVTWRKSKLGFVAPESKWMKEHKSNVESAVMQSPLLANLLAPKATMKKVLLAAKPGLRWRLYSLALWARAFNVSDLS
jgi:asparagine synthase (glutamine-hydrolysing)